MALSAAIGEVIPRFPEFRVAFVVAENLRLQEDRSPDLDALIAAREEDCRQRWAGRELSDIPGIAAWRAACVRNCDSEKVCIKASMGVAWSLNRATTAERLVARADEAMYEAKRRADGRPFLALPTVEVEQADRRRGARPGRVLG